MFVPEPPPKLPQDRIAVGSRNAPKVDAVREAFEAYGSDARVVGVAVESGVSEQPIGWEEIVAGAMNRAERAFSAMACDLGVGYEDGLVEVPGTATGHVNFGCCAIFDGKRHALGFSAGFEYPLACTEAAVGRRIPVGDTFDDVFARAAGAAGGAGPEARDRKTGRAAAGAAEPSSLTVGNVGRLTGERLVRREYTRHAVLCALIQLRHPTLYFGAR
jgi:inosine/xanthosine triphosphatase